ncbi:class I SAM-dependent methyltransferase [Candidatus Binatia bacterium]|jgi:predicted O-methyltransferase YrrM|nr:class I SAM-dependent methyltransferase [Candidatus Binatia bacterium]
MSAIRDPISVIPDHRVRDLLAELHRAAERDERWLMLRGLDQLPRLLTGRGISWERFGPRLAESAICIDRSQGALCYLLARAIGARTIVEFGTSFGISTIWLAMAVRANGGGRVIGTELVSSKAARARENLRAAGLDDLVEIREGDATESLRDLDESMDFFLNDGFPPAMLAVARLVCPRMRKGAILVSDNVGAFWADHDDDLAWLRGPESGFETSLIALNEGTEISVKS